MSEKYMGETLSSENLEIEVQLDRKTLGFTLRINIEGKCFLRICQIPSELIIQKKEEKGKIIEECKDFIDIIFPKQPSKKKLIYFFNLKVKNMSIYNKSGVYNIVFVDMVASGKPESSILEFWGMDYLKFLRMKIIHQKKIEERVNEIKKEREIEESEEHKIFLLGRNETKKENEKEIERIKNENKL